jgi:hypothetical protein
LAATEAPARYLKQAPLQYDFGQPLKYRFTSESYYCEGDVARFSQLTSATILLRKVGEEKPGVTLLTCEVSDISGSERPPEELKPFVFQIKVKTDGQVVAVTEAPNSPLRGATGLQRGLVTNVAQRAFLLLNAKDVGDEWSVTLPGADLLLTLSAVPRQNPEVMRFWLVDEVVLDGTKCQLIAGFGDPDRTPGQLGYSNKVISAAVYFDRAKGRIQRARWVDRFADHEPNPNEGPDAAKHLTNIYAFQLVTQ